ncbi:MAG TPA: O-antigen ligase family protein [Pyrinomonadaceae bacterium]|jgi:O-antigen ligase|nr:O-antigen ligase family protein [Pyrinomonadaceae bacterium]
MGRNSYFSDYEPVTRSRRTPVWEDETEGADEPWLPSKVGPAAEEELHNRAEQQPQPAPSSETPALSSPAHSSNAKPESIFRLKRGHALSYAGLFLYTIAVYFRPYELHPSLAWSINISFWFAIFTLLAFVPSQIAMEGRPTVRTREVDCVLLLCLLILISIPLGISPGESFYTFIDGFAKVAIMFIVMVNVTRTRLRLNGLIFLGLAVACMMSISHFEDYWTGNFSVEGYRVGKINHGMFTDPDDSALHLVTMIPLAVGLMLGSRNIFKKILLGVCALLMIGGMVFTFSRGGFLGFIAIVAVLGWKFGRRNRLAVMLLLFVFAIAFAALVPGHYPTRILSIFDHSLDPVGSAGARTALLLRSIYVTLTHPLLGVGLGNFPIVSISGKVTHNAYTQIGAEVGIPALIVYVLMMLYALKRLAGIERETQTERRDNRFHSLSIALQASLIGYMVSSFFISVGFGWYVYYLVGYAVCLRRLYEARAQISPDEKRQELKPAA